MLLLLWTVVCLTLSGATTWWLLRRSVQAQQRHLRILHDAVADLAGALQAITATLQTPPPPQPWTGAFLPTDETAAEIETQLQRSEDHAIAAGTPFGGPSRRWGGGSVTVSSTPRAKRSGRR
jgi:hypothetical protein